jgi:sodium/proline symporter
MSIALIVVLGYGVSVAGGMGQVIENGRELAGYLSLVSSHDPTTGTASPYGFITIISTLAWGLGYFGMPHILLRFMAIESTDKIKLSRRIATIWVFIAMTAGIMIGIVGYGVSKAGALPILEGSASETIIVKIANLIASHGIFPALVAGVILAGILAATMSTSDSQLLAASSSVSQNLIKEVFGLKISKEGEMVIARVTVLVIAIIAMFLARNPDSSVFQIVSFAWAGFGAAFGPAVLCSLFWKRTNFYGVLAGMICGGGMVFIWKFLVRPLGGAWNIYELLPAFLVALAAIIIVSLLTPEPSKEIQDEFETVKAM